MTLKFNLHFLSFLFYLILSIPSFAQIYVSPSGDDANPGTFDLPFKSLTKAVSVSGPDTLIFMRGGIYNESNTIRLNKSGLPDKQIKLFAYPGEKPIIDFAAQAFGSRGIQISHNYWYVKGLTIRYSGDNGIYISAWYTTVENCEIYECKDTGLQIGGGGSYNNIINCDSYFNADPGQGNADGFAAKLDVGTDNYFYGCRAWQNSDDGWDGYLRGAIDVNTVVENSWCFANGYLKSGAASNGNGNGYKMGGGDNGNSAALSNNFTLIRSIAFDNRVKGFDQNNNRGSMTLYNCSAYRNGTNYSIPSAINSGKVASIINSLALGSRGNVANHVVQQTNSWLAPFSISEGDFLSIDTTGVRAPRKADGSLPDISFLHLDSTSDMINGGTDLGLPFIGSAPDLGAFEYDPPVPVELASFSISIDENKILLNWVTSTELNNLGFEVQRKLIDSENDNSSFVSIGFVKGMGSSTKIKNYYFSDVPYFYGKIAYRLKQIDFSGSFSYSNVVEVQYNIPFEFSLSQNFPNPFNPATKINFTVNQTSEVNLTVYNMLGERAAELIKNEIKLPGSYSINFDASHLSSGTYIYRLKQGRNIQSKVMVLLK